MHHLYFWENIIDILSLGVCHWLGAGRDYLSNAWNVGHEKLRALKMFLNQKKGFAGVGK